MATVFYLALFLCMNGTKPCAWAHTQQVFRGTNPIADCMAAGVKAAAAWNKDRDAKGGKMVAVGVLCDDEPPGPGDDL